MPGQSVVFIISNLLPEAECQVSRLEKECYVVSCPSQGIECVAISPAELLKQSRFVYRQLQNNGGGNAQPAPSSPPKAPDAK